MTDHSRKVWVRLLNPVILGTELQSLSLNEERLPLSACHQHAQNTSLPCVHTVRRYY